MKALVLAAGYATRLYPLTKDKPKALLPLGRRLIIDYLIEKLDRIDELDGVYIVTNQKFYAPFDDWLKKSKFRKKISLLNDRSTDNENRLGAIGDIKLALDSRKKDEDFLVLASDNLFEEDLNGFVRYAKEKADSFAMCAYDIGEVSKAGKYGVMEVAEDGRIVNFLEKPAEPPSSLIATGIYYYPRNKSDLVNRYLNVGNPKDAPGNFIEWLHKQCEVRCYVLKGLWYDIGDIESYNEANEIFSKRQ